MWRRRADDSRAGCARYWWWTASDCAPALVTSSNADGDPLVRTGPYADDPFVVERALQQTFPPPYGTEPEVLESYAEEIATMLDNALQLRVHEPAARFAQEYDVDDDGSSKHLERLQRACDVRRIWMDR